MSEGSTLLEIQQELNNLMKDLEARIIKVYDKYTVNKDIPELPPYKELRSDEVRYECIRRLVSTVDELIDIKLRVGLLKRNMSKYKNFQPSSKTEYTITVSFRNNINDYINSLVEYSIEISTIIKNANDKISTLESAQFFDI